MVFIREKDTHVLTRILLPLIGDVACYLEIDEYAMLTGTELGW